MSEKKNGKSGGFLTKTGMTVIVLLCVCIAGMSYSIIKAYRAVRELDTVSFNADAWQEAVEDAEKDVSEPTALPEVTEDAVDEDYVAAEIYEPEEGFTEEPDTPVIPVFNDNVSGLSMTMPLAGRIINDYSADELVYSETFNDWRVHLGIDIEAEEGTAVSAAAAGVVEKIYTDDSSGLTVIIRHTSYICTMYAGLSATDLTEGAVIGQGETVGLSGNSAAFESMSAPHLHFEVQRDGEPADPYEYLIFEE